jgi:SAM-dependent methyltransferase
MNEIESNKHAWGQLSEEHYHYFKKALLNKTYQLNKHIHAEIGDLTGKKVIHLQCNTGADTIMLAQLAEGAVGVDIVPDNILYAEKLAHEMGATNASFIESDIMNFMEKHNEKYDVVFVSEGAIGWLPDLNKWGQTIRHLLKDDGYVYIFEGHPIVLMFDESKLSKGITEIKYPYFKKSPDIDNTIGGYAAETKQNVETYFWMYKTSDILNALISAGLHIEFFHEFQENFYDINGSRRVDGNLYNFDYNDGLFPMSFSLKASVYRKWS